MTETITVEVPRRGIGSDLTEALAGLDRTQEVLAEHPEDEDIRRVRKIDSIQGVVAFDNVSLRSATW